MTLVLLLAVAIWFSRRTVLGWFGHPTIQSVAVLPLKNLSNDSNYEYFAEGMTEQLITDLSYAKPLRVLSRSSTTSFRNSALSDPQIADQLHVDALIEGTVLRVNDTIRVTIRLTAVRPESQLWAASYERTMNDAITLQNQLAADAVRQMRAELSPEGQRQLALESKISPGAYDEYLRGRFLFARRERRKIRPFRTWNGRFNSIPVLRGRMRHWVSPTQWKHSMGEPELQAAQAPGDGMQKHSKIPRRQWISIQLHQRLTRRWDIRRTSLKTVFLKTWPFIIT